MPFSKKRSLPVNSTTVGSPSSPSSAAAAIPAMSPLSSHNNASSMLSTSPTSRFSLRSKSLAPTVSKDTLTAHGSLLRVVNRRSNDSMSGFSPPVVGLTSSAPFAQGKQQTPTLTSSSSLPIGGTVLSPGDPKYDPLKTPITSYPVDQLGVPSFKHEEFGWCANQDYRHVSQYTNSEPIHQEPVEPPYYVFLTTYVSYLLLIFVGHMRDFFGKRMYPSFFRELMPHDGYAALNSDFDSFYTRRLKTRIEDCFSHPVTGVPGRSIQTFDRSSNDSNLTFQYPGTKTRCLNISSYNYLGFAQATGGCADAVEEAIKRYGVTAAGARLDASTLDLHIQAESLVAKFVGKEDAMVVSMGFATNSTTIPALVSKGCLVISDEFNHSSIRFGVRLSGASVRQFKHNDMKDLENLLREVISQGQPRTHRPWKKIMVIVEGLYSMEGTLVDLPRLIQLKEKYKFYLYVDEAHSIGALGPNGRGVCDYFSIDPRNIDILMGTLTKSFGAAGGYIAADKSLISRLRLRSHAMCYAEAMSPAVITQIIASIGSIMGIAPPLALPAPDNSNVQTEGHSTTVQTGVIYDAPVYGPAPASGLPSWMNLPPNLMNGTEGRERLRRLAFNARYLSGGLKKLGFIVYGSRDSPIVPMLTFNPAKMPLFSRMMFDRLGGPDTTPIVVVVVGYPATPLVTSRVRFCVSAAHTKDDIDIILRACDEIGDVLDLKQTSPEGGRWKLEDVLANAKEISSAP
ncbi:serine palmitoyltransferase 2 [Phaffia rhodozyma]|uniref:serine C-palmitoyltransferase n=1 Tax=Phaffia rhodozyma TaxID=264483 RepID=A0A0F7SLS0_PHARH|nr:serine palmitoyltransferase 2 [Phaffia rhodozyma]